MKTYKYMLALVLVWFSALGGVFAIDKTYYNSIDGTKEGGLRDALYTITSVGPSNMSYNKLWEAYKTTDVYPKGHEKAGDIWDMYSDCTFVPGTDQCGTYGNECDCYNREHSMPKSWFNEEKPAYYDLGHIVPTDGKVNGIRSNYAFGEVGTSTKTFSHSKAKYGNAKAVTTANTVKGSITTTYTGTVFEPDDQYKGDFARMYMYMRVRYKSMSITSGDGSLMFNSTDANYGMTDYSIALLMKWHRGDAVSQKEIDRNNGMQNVQGNRNPFIDYPELAEYLWGNKAGSTVSLSALTATFESGYTPGEGGGEGGGGSEDEPTTYDVTLYRNGVATVYYEKTGTFDLPAKASEAAACTGWAFDGWSASEVSSTTSKPQYINSVNTESTVYAVYAKTVENSSMARRNKAEIMTLWAEDFSSYSANGIPSGDVDDSQTGTTVYGDGAVTYSVTNGGGATKIYSETLAGGTAPELLIAKGGGSFSISGIPTAGAMMMTLTFRTNKTSDISVTSETPGITVGNVNVDADTKTATCEITTSNVESFDLTITNTLTSNIRVDNFLLVGDSDGSTPTITYDSEPLECSCTAPDKPVVTATPGDELIVLVWQDVAGADHYTVTVDPGEGFTTRCAEREAGEITHTGSEYSCEITGLVNGLSYTVYVVANGIKNGCDSERESVTAVPVRQEVPTQITPEVVQPATDVRKVLIDAQLYIVRDGKTFTVTGLRVK